MEACVSSIYHLPRIADGVAMAIRWPTHRKDIAIAGATRGDNQIGATIQGGRLSSAKAAGNRTRAMTAPTIAHNRRTPLENSSLCCRLDLLKLITRSAQWMHTSVPHTEKYWGIPEGK